MSEELRNLYEAVKEVSGAPQWIERAPNGLLLVTPLEIQGETIQGLRLRVTTLNFLADRNVCFQLEHLGRRSKFDPLCRLEWKPLAAHSNKGRGPPEYQFVRITGTHIHPFEMNLADSLRASSNRNLRLAVPVNPDPSTFEEVLELAGKEFRISNMRAVPRPPWQQRMF